MGNSSTKESRGPVRSRPGSIRNISTSESPALPGATPADRLVQEIYGSGGRIARSGRNSSRPDLSFHFGLTDRDGLTPEQRRETKQEREARRVEKEAQLRAKEREKSLNEEHVDGGYLVTLGTYTGPEDFNKGVVRQLQVVLTEDSRNLHSADR